MRLFIRVAAVVAIGVGVMTTTASAAPSATSTFHFKGRAGAAVLTDCPMSAAVGTHCRAVDVFAFEQRVNDDGERVGGPGLDVTLFDVVITDAAPFFAAVPIGAGFSDSARVSMTNNLSRGSAAATDVPLCETFACDPGAPQSVSIDVEWTGVGPTSTFKSHDKFTDPFCRSNSHTKGTTRNADAGGVLDGVAVVVPINVGFQATLQTDKFGSVDRCTVP